MPRRRDLWLAAPTLLTAGRTLAQGADASAWPQRPVRIIVPFGLGGSADVAARFLAEPLSAAFGQPFVIENRPGAGATIGTDQVAKSAPDGHTLLLMSNAHTANETLLPNRPYVLLRDLAPVAAINVAYHALVVHPAIGADSVAGLIALLKAHPGRYDYASSGPGTPYHIAGEVFRAMAGVEMQHVPFRGSNEARTAVIAGQVPIMFDAIPSLLPMIQADKLRPLAAASAQRNPILPNVPTFDELGIKGMDVSLWYGIVGPAALPQPIVQKLNAELTRILAMPDVQQAFAKQGAIPSAGSPQDFAAFMRDESARWGEVVRKNNIKLEQ
jgi:tripartite-type tricarboxylate transporter receptor subunit TctC